LVAIGSDATMPPLHCHRRGRWIPSADLDRRLARNGHDDCFSITRPAKVLRFCAFTPGAPTLSLGSTTRWSPLAPVQEQGGSPSCAGQWRGRAAVGTVSPMPALAQPPRPATALPTAATDAAKQAWRAGAPLASGKRHSQPAGQHVCPAYGGRSGGLPPRVKVAVQSGDQGSVCCSTAACSSIRLCL